ncbi:histone deacetylase complex subunit SAP25 isoform X2 [Zalophus californianus]|uniref:Histone deacetylase complex subunit SAP25 isoform X2 n=1 Tax=Zalophus californianus TaxID=9704 RepID=A0A6P9EYD7_ZALCA|nr:histone deacetylase complex subunit SAP25 isoform X2 [Zalophus californianus]
MNAVRRGAGGANTPAPGFCSWPRRGATPPGGTAGGARTAPTPPPGGARETPGGSARHVARKRAGRCRGREALRDAACCPGRLGCGTRAKSRRPRNKAPRRAVTPAGHGPLERKHWGSQGLPHRTGEGLRRREMRHGAHRVRKSQSPTLRNGCAETPGPRHPWPCLRNSRGGREGCSSVPPPPSPQPRSRRPSCTRRAQLLPWAPPGLAAVQSPGAPGALPPHVAWEVAPSRMTVLAPWDPRYKAKAGPRLVWGPSCASGASFSGRTLSHPSFWPLCEAAPGRDLRPLAPAAGYQNGEHARRDAGFPAVCREAVFLSDPLLPCGQRVPLYLSEASQQVTGSLKLLLPPPVMSPWVLRTPSPGCSTAWLSGPELIALTGLLQMSQGAPRPASPGAPTPPAGPPDPVADHPGPRGSPSCSHCTDPSVPRTPDAR